MEMKELEKVIKGLEQFKSDLKPFCGNNADWKKVDDAIALLKGQEPVAVYESKISRCACGNTVNRYWHPKFCGYCGKELMWY